MYEQALFTPRYRLQRTIRKIPNLLAYFPINEIEGTTIRNYAPGNLGNLSGTSTAVTVGSGGKQGRAGSFNGTTSKITHSVLTTAIRNVSIGCFYKSTDITQTRQPIISNGNGAGGGMGYALVLSGNSTTDGSMYLLNHNAAWVSLGYKTTDNNWHCIVLTIDGSDNTLVYSDGALRFTGGNASLGIPATNSYIGTDNSANAFLKGAAQHAFVVSRALTAQEILKIARIGGVA